MISLSRPHPQARYFAPEIVQTSAMDCGPASLQALIQGFDLSVNYGRLREVCQTAVDGTSISTMDEVANLLGLDTEEMMIPIDHLLIPEAHALPAIVVVQNPDGSNHFVVVWSVVGPWIQVMDPAEGRHWTRRSALFDRLYTHTLEVPAAAWRDWVAEPEFQGTLAVRLAALGITEADRQRLCAAALADPGWHGMAALDAATRMTASMIESKAATPGAVCLSLIERMIETSGEGRTSFIAAEYWSAFRTRPQREQVTDEPMMTVRGAVLMRARGRHAPKPGATTKAGAGEPPAEGSNASTESSESADAVLELPPELAANLNEAPSRPGRTLLNMLVADGLTAPLVLGMVMVVSAAMVTVDAILLRGLLEVAGQLGLPGQRAVAMAGLIGFLALGVLVQLPLIAGALRLGRTLDLRLRLAFMAKLPRLDDRYFRSRLLSDMAERGHSLHLVRSLPALGVRLLGSSAQLILTVAGIAWLDPASTPLALASVVVGIGLPLLCQPLMAERELRLRTHASALGRFYLDALLGLLPIRVHGARPAMQRQQESLLVQWVSAGLRFHAAATLVEGAVALCGLAMAVLMVRSVASHSTSGLLLLVYWALSLPALGGDIAMVARQYPVLRNVVARLLEPLSTPEAEHSSTSSATALPGSEDAREDAAEETRERSEHAATKGVEIRMTNVAVKAGGHTVLEDIELTIKPGEHIAIIGASGAGKSSLVGLLLGWYRASHGTVEIDRQPLVGAQLSKLRRETAWVDPAVALWNRSLLDNLRYGAIDGSELALAEILSRARLREVLEHLPEGLATALGEGGAMVSGGEGQRTRVGRALARRQARLAILDEPFRGLDLTTRRELMAMARQWWSHATLLLVTHDIAETESFDRVLVIDGGKLVEDGDPRQLGQRPSSRYATLVRSDRELRAAEWAGTRWRRVWISEGKLREEGEPS